MSGDQADISEKKYKHKLDGGIFNCLSTLKSVKFGFLKFGPLCNASESNAFTSARCGIIQERRPYTIDFKTLFKLGLDLLEKLKLEEEPTLSDKNITAIKILEAFIEQKAIHETSLIKILFDKDKKYSEADFTVTFAEHLFKLLAPGQHYVIDKGSRGKCSCKCGRKDIRRNDICAKDTHFGKTGIGHEDVWHGFIDLVLVSNEGATEDSVRWRNIIEVKRSLLRSKFAVMDQAIAQTIVFSFLKKRKRPNIFIPNILISPKEFRVIMYNAEKDLLICSGPRNLFTEQDSTRCLNFSSLIVLWMVLHYETFLEDVIQVVQEDCIQQVNAKFDANTNGDYLTEIKSSVNKFPTPTNKGYFPDSESLAKGKNISRKNDSVNALARSVHKIKLDNDQESTTESKSGKTNKEN